jgi:hypothetical protein
VSMFLRVASCYAVWGLRKKRQRFDGHSIALCNTSAFDGRKLLRFTQIQSLETHSRGETLGQTLEAFLVARTILELNDI